MAKAGANGTRVAFAVRQTEFEAHSENIYASSASGVQGAFFIDTAKGGAYSRNYVGNLSVEGIKAVRQRPNELHLNKKIQTEG